MLDCTPHKDELRRRLETVRDILAATDQSSVNREARGMAVVLIYASYENLLKSLSRSLLESAVQVRAGNRRLKPGLQLFAIFGRLQAISGSSASQIWKGGGAEVVSIIGESKNCTINTNTFPNDGSNMKCSQVLTFCEVFDLGNPAPILREVWGKLDGVVVERNAVAHGQHTPDEIGRNYTEQEMLDLVRLWEDRWIAFIEWIEGQASSRDFFRSPR